MSFPPNRSRPSRKPAEADLRGTMSRSDSMDPSVPQFVPSQPKNDNKGSGSTSGLPFTSPPSIRGHRAEVFDHRSNDQRLIEWMQTRFNHIIMTIKETSSIPKNVQDNVAAELRNFIVDFSAKQTLATEAEERLINKIRELERKLIAASRDYADEPGAPTIKELETVIARQREELQIKENQLNGKRILWLASHPPASQQRVDSSSFNLPHSSSRSQTQLRLEAPPSINNSLVNYRTTGNSSMARLSRASLAAMESAAVGDNVSPTQEEYNRVKSSVTVAVPDSALESMPSILDLHNYRNSETETVINQRRSQMPIVPYKNPTVSINEMCISFTKEFGEMFGSMEGWCREYCCVPDLAGDRIIASTNQNLWNYMMSLTYKDPQSAHSHVMALLGNKDTRHWFIMRMALEYCFTQIMSIKSFEQYNHGVHAHLDSIKKRLVAKPLPSAEDRQKLVAEQSDIIKSVINKPDYVVFRNDALVDHTKALRDMLGPLMNKGCSRSKAGSDLGLIIINCMEVAAKMWTARLSFQIVFPDLLGNKFTAGTMIAKDHPHDNPYQLQTKQKRLKLVMTPSITMRDDNSITIIAKNLHKANVLLMT